MERWRQPAIPVALEPDTGTIWHDGERDRANVNATFRQEDIDRLRLGYLCLRCWEPQEEPMPEACSLCGYAMRDRQVEDFGREFEGDKHIGPSKALRDELERLELEREQRIWTPKPSIIVPRNAS